MKLSELKSLIGECIEEMNLQEVKPYDVGNRRDYLKHREKVKQKGDSLKSMIRIDRNYGHGPSDDLTTSSRDKSGKAIGYRPKSSYKRSGIGKMKLSELKSIIMECIDELNEGPARDYRRKHGISYKTAGRDELRSREKNSKRSPYGWRETGIGSKKPLKDMIKRNIRRKDFDKFLHKDGKSVVHFKKAKGGSKESARQRQWNIDHVQNSGFAKITKRGKLPK